MAAKIKDGLFIGDAETSQSEVFINDNKISNLVNLAGREVHNVWASHGLVYLTYYWEDRPDYKLFAGGHEDPMLTDIVEFIDVSIEHGISVLLFSRRGTGRCVVAACVYLMMKYRWGFEKTYDYVYSKKPDIDLNKGFIQQMFALDMKLLASRQKAYAAKHGIGNTFKIEANMTISDISAMLPSVEALRWNDWDPKYVQGDGGSESRNVVLIRGPFEGDLDLNDNERSSEQDYPEVKAGNTGGSSNSHESKDHKSADHGKATAATMRRSLSGKTPLTASSKLSAPSHSDTQSKRDREDELVLIYSFINSKNTITSLPGPYYNAYDTHKSFKLRFDQEIFEEDVNMFPVAPCNPRHTSVPRGVLKGAPSRIKRVESSNRSAPDAQHVEFSNDYVAEPKDALPTNDINGITVRSKSTAKRSSSESNAEEPERISKVRADAQDHSPRAGAKIVGVDGSDSNPLETIAPMHVINSARQQHSGISGTPIDGKNSSGTQDLPAAQSNGEAQKFYSPPTHYAAPLDDNSPHQQQESRRKQAKDAAPPVSEWEDISSVASSIVSSNAIGGNSAVSQRSSDLYEFVGVTAPASDRDSRRRLSADSDAKISSSADDFSSSSVRDRGDRDRPRGRGAATPAEHKADVAPPSVGTTSRVKRESSSLTAEERLRNLMADMQKHKSMNNEDNSVGRYGNRRSTRNESPSLYDLATMHMAGGSGTGDATTGRSYDERRKQHADRSSTAYGGNSSAFSSARTASASMRPGGPQRHIDRPANQHITGEEAARTYGATEDDPLAAFDMMQGDSQRRQPSVRAGGAVRARHDVITSSTNNPPSSSGMRETARGSGVSANTGPRPAWGSNGSLPQRSGSYRDSPSRHSSPSSGTRRQQSSNLSVHSIGSSGTAASNNVREVGSGAYTASRTYRQGSPAPNLQRGASRSASGGVNQRGRVDSYRESTDRNSSSLRGGGTNSMSSSMSSLGSGIMNQGNTSQDRSGSNRYLSSAVAGNNVSSSRQRAPSPTQAARSSSARGDPPLDRGSSRRSPSPYLQSSGGTASDRQQRRTSNSPMRSSITGPSSSRDIGNTRSSGGVSSRRFSTPTPQSTQHNDYESTASAGSNRTTGSARAQRSSTPTRAQWRF